MDREDRKKMALVRVSALGPLISARLKHGDKAELFEQAAGRTYEGPDGQPITVTARTVEEWYYSWLAEGFDGLITKQRSDAGTSRVITPEIGEQILQLKAEKPRRSIRRIIKTLERGRKVAKGELKKSTVHRFLKGHGMSRRPRRVYEERRAFRHPWAGDLWMGDVMHGPKVIAPDGKERKSYLHVELDSATRFVPGCTFRLGETAVDLQVVLKESFLKYGLPRVLYLDQGAAQRADSLSLICAELGIRLLHCRPYDPEAKAGVERFIRTVREEVMDEIGDRILELAELNSLTWSWLSAEYHRRVHSGTGRQPLGHWLSQVHKLRTAPRIKVDKIFLHREQRQVRKDGTLQFAGRLLEVRPELAGHKVELRFDPEHPEGLPQVFADGDFFCDTVELDVIRNSSRKRRRINDDPKAEEHPAAPATGLDPLSQIREEHDRRSAPPGPKPRGRKEE
jgi:transposase InsO family protein